MILVISTSSPLSSVAFIDTKGNVLASASAEAQRRASAVVLEMLKEIEAVQGLKVSESEGFVADIGPGSFTGVKVGTTMAKTFGYSFGKMVAGITSFDLISVDREVVIPNVSGRYFVRAPGSEGALVTGLPDGDSLGYGPNFKEKTFPEASRATESFKNLSWVEPEILVPLYIAEPNISIPKREYGSLVKGTIPGANS